MCLLDNFLLRIFWPQVILIHGLSVPSLIYHRLVPFLTSANHRVLLYDLYGRGYSDAPQTTYDAPLYAIQLALLMQHVRWDSARLVGLSMGGSIVAYFTSTFPWLVENKVALLASTGLVEVIFMSCFLFATLLTRLPVDRHFANRQANVIAAGAIIRWFIRSSSHRFLPSSPSILTSPPEVHAATYKFYHWRHIRTNK
jgi:pimeloyl-ACP methyl ester carboxylesterase